MEGPGAATQSNGVRDGVSGTIRPAPRAARCWDCVTWHAWLRPPRLLPQPPPVLPRR